MLHPSFQSYLPQLKQVFNKYKVRNAYVFGSVLTDRFNQNSDIDFVVNFIDYSDPLEVGESIWDLEEEIEKITARKIDLLTERSLKNPYFIQELNNTKQLVYEYQTEQVFS
jgi:predicted nucleotidyltransferase